MWIKNNVTSCPHKWKIEQWSNVLQLDDMGYPLRLCIQHCHKCVKTDQAWIDVSKEELKELDSGESVLLLWR